MSFRTKRRTVINYIDDNFVVRHLLGGFSRIWEEKLARVALIWLIFVFIIGLFGPYLAPHEYDAMHRTAEGELLRAEGPSLAHPLGTTLHGQDVLSRVIIGARPTMLAGILGGALIISIGASIGMTAGYVGGKVDGVLMRITDFAYSLPLIPFAIVLMAFFGIGFFSTIVLIGFLLWRSSARVIRSQVLQIKERPFILSAQAVGTSTPLIILKHILPNVAAMAVLFFAMGVGYTILAIAGLAFLGITDPFVPSWGVIIRNAYNSGYMAQQWLWTVVPGVAIALTVLSTFLVGRVFEEEDSDSQVGGM